MAGWNTWLQEIAVVEVEFVPRAAEARLILVTQRYSTLELVRS
jgi:hypothetical protein